MNRLFAEAMRPAEPAGLIANMNSPSSPVETKKAAHTKERAAPDPARGQSIIFGKGSGSGILTRFFGPSACLTGEYDRKEGIDLLVALDRIDIRAEAYILR